MWPSTIAPNPIKAECPRLHAPIVLAHGLFGFRRIGLGPLTLTWYFRVLRHVASGYRIFVHVDGQGQRIHGDHDPVDGKYPVQLEPEVRADLSISRKADH